MGYQAPIRMVEKVKRHLDILTYSWRLARGRPQPLIPTVARALRLYRQRRFLAEEAFDLGLLRLDCDQELLEGVVSRRRQAQIQRRINPTSWAPLLSDKGVFYRFCGAVGLPTPELYAIYFRKTPGYCPKGRPLYTSQQWVDFVARELPREFIVKPCVGYGGSSVVAFERMSPDEFLDNHREKLTAGQMVDFLSSCPGVENFVIQERLRSHRALCELTGSSNLQTARITTYVDRHMQCRLLFSFLKLMTRDETLVDNIGSGRSGNLLNEVCAETGTIVASYVKTHDGSGDRPISLHPVTNQPLTGFQIPCWDEACGLVRRAAHALLPVRAVGWDVAFTDNGVKILEGNIWWDRFSHDNDYVPTLLDDLNASTT